MLGYYDDGYVYSNTTAPSSYVYSGNAAVEVFRQAAGPSYGAGLAWLVVINAFFAGFASVSVTGRITFALARDGATPFSDVMRRVHPVIKSPANALMLVWGLDALILLLPLGTTVAFYSITGIVTIGFQVSYGIPILLKLLFVNKRFEDEVVFPLTPLSLGKWSRVFGVISCVWLFGTSCIFFLPTVSPVEDDTMNYTIVIIAGFFSIGVVNWLLNSQYHFRGPKRTHLSAKQTYEMKQISAAPKN